MPIEPYNLNKYEQSNPTLSSHFKYSYVKCEPFFFSVLELKKVIVS